MNATDIAMARRFWGSYPPQEKVMAFNSNNQPTYIAYGSWGSSTSTANWIVKKLVYDTNSVYSYSQHSQFNQIADNFLILQYG